NRSLRLRRSGGSHPPCSVPATSEHQLAEAWRQPLQPCKLPCHRGPPGCQKHTSSRTTSVGVDQRFPNGTAALVNGCAELTVPGLDIMVREAASQIKDLPLRACS